MEQVGSDEVRAKIGADPTGMPFNSVVAIELHGGKPLTPLVNAGAMATVSSAEGVTPDERWQQAAVDLQQVCRTTAVAEQGSLRI